MIDFPYLLRDFKLTNFDLHTLYEYIYAVSRQFTQQPKDMILNDPDFLPRALLLIPSLPSRSFPTSLPPLLILSMPMYLPASHRTFLSPLLSASLSTSHPPFHPPSLPSSYPHQLFWSIFLSYYFNILI